MKKLLNNEKGSVLSTAIVIIALLSLTLTSVTAQTSNIASRTNASVNRDDELEYAQFKIRSALQDMRMFLEGESKNAFSCLDNNFDEQIINEINNDFNDRISNSGLYDEVASEDRFNIRVLETGASLDCDVATRSYVASFRKSNDRTITKRLSVELTDEDSQSSGVKPNITDVEGITNFIFNDYLTAQFLESDDAENFEVHENTYNPTGGGQGSFQASQDLFVNDSFSYSVTGTGGNATFSFNEFIFVKEDFNLTNVPTINGPGIIIVDGNFNMTTGNGVQEFNFNNGNDLPLIILVKGNVNLDIGHNNYRDIYGDNFHIFSNQNIDTNANNSSNFEFDERPLYFGTDGDFDFDDIFEFTDIFNVNEGFDFNYFESSFEVE